MSILLGPGSTLEVRRIPGQEVFDDFADNEYEKKRAERVPEGH
jgi:hypothetical protein